MPPERSEEKLESNEKKAQTSAEALKVLKKEVNQNISVEAKRLAEEYKKKRIDVKHPDIAKAIGLELPIPPEQLAVEYKMIDLVKERTGIISSTRSQIKQLLDFVIRVIPNYFKQLFQKAPEHSIDDLEKLGVETKTLSPLVDLSAFDLDKLRNGKLNIEKLKEKGINELVLMEDRDPLFFLNYANYSPDSPVPLDRHGRPPQNWTMADLKMLVEAAHKAGIKVTIGFWGNCKNAQNNPFLKKNWEAIKPVIPGSEDLNPLSIVKDQNGKDIPFADYVTKQYSHLVKDFHFDGLFLGDGLMGYRNFHDSEAPHDFSDTTKLWTDFYRRMYLGVHKATPDGKLWAYDVMGKGSSKSIKHGVDLKALTPYLDSYVFQAYGSDAWGKDYMKLPGYDLERDQKEIKDLPPELAAKTKYTLAMGDKVEGWSVSQKTIQEKHRALAGSAKQGAFGVWSNQAVRGLI